VSLKSFWGRGWEVTIGKSRFIVWVKKGRGVYLVSKGKGADSFIGKGGLFDF